MKLVQIYFKKLNKVAVISNFLAFFQFLVDKFTLLDPDPGGKMNADPCGSGSTALTGIGTVPVPVPTYLHTGIVPCMKKR